MEAVGRSARETYQVSNPFGLKRYFYSKKDAPPDGASTKIQSTAAMIMWNTLHPSKLEADIGGLGGQLLNFVHDSYVLQVPTGKEEQAREALMYNLCVEWPEVNGLRVPIKVKQSTSSWGECE
jgi:DNA polymerase I-like protein with 3'-5' exonuclease and polymerase domains